MLNILSTGDEDGTRQKIILAISLNFGKSFSFSLKNSPSDWEFLSGPVTQQQVFH